ncbi:hypothetical protein J2S43_008250 [Catenuloplanes nepalensis]|uniref:Uncharacterized protein n=1 Tax=Catenuloplanes nepalensis TaxID=587533 RepID=A0ABT9N7R6_9ACTN|nr:hypothetical protein [Catenuloplanes nepalensis]
MLPFGTRPGVFSFSFCDIRPVPRDTERVIRPQ